MEAKEALKIEGSALDVEILHGVRKWVALEPKHGEIALLALEDALAAVAKQVFVEPLLKGPPAP
jgi:hypothetical protein